MNDFWATTTPSPVIWHDDKATYTVDLTVSTFIRPEILLASIEEQYDLLLGEKDDVYVPPEDNPFNTLTQTLPGLGYMIHMTQPVTQTATLLITGTRVSEDRPLPLHQGWNWMGYLPDCTLPVTVALASIEGRYNLLLGEEGTYVPSGDPRFNTLAALEPGEGYLIRMTEVGTLVYPAGTCEPSIAALSSEQCDVPQTPYFSHYYGQATLNGQPVPVGTRVRAFNPRGDEVGCFEVTSQGLYGYMRVYGEDTGVTPPIPGMRAGEEVSFRIGDLPAIPLPAPVRWQDDRGVHRLDLATSVWETYLPLILKSYDRRMR